MISYLPEDYDTYVERLERCNGAVLKNEHPKCCGDFMVYLGSDKPWWNTTDHYTCYCCGNNVAQNDHEVCPDWETSDNWQSLGLSVDYVGLKAA